MSRIPFLNISVDNITMDQAIAEIDQLIHQNKNAYVVTPNLDHIVMQENDAEFAEIYRNADLVLTDGKPLIWLSKWFGTPICEKISGSDLFPQICSLAAEKGYRVFFLGAAEGVAEKAAENLSIKFPGFNVAGVYSPPFGFEKDEAELERIFEKIRTADPHILITALGTPKQEKFLYRYRDRLQIPVSLGLGASLDFEAGNVKRAPKWVSELGFEWLFRITQDPKRLAKRYWHDFICIMPIIWKYRKNKREN